MLRNWRISVPKNSYRIYSYDDALRIVTSDWIHAHNDEEALAQATALRFTKAELWTDDHMIAQLGAEHQNPPPKASRTRSSDSGGYWAALALVLGLLVPVLGFVAIWMGFSAHDARKDANKAAAAVSSGSAMAGMDMSGGGGLQSFAGQAPSNADVLAKKHVAMDATLPSAPSGPVARVNLVLVDKTIEIAPGVKRVAALRDATVASGIGQFAAIQAAGSVDMELSAIELRDAGPVSSQLNGGRGSSQFPGRFGIGHRHLNVRRSLDYRYRNAKFAYFDGWIVFEP